MRSHSALVINEVVSACATCCDLLAHAHFTAEITYVISCLVDSSDSETVCFSDSFTVCFLFQEYSVDLILDTFTCDDLYRAFLCTWQLVVSAGAAAEYC